MFQNIIPEYYNGFFEYHLNAADLELASGKIRAEETKDGIVIANDSQEDGGMLVVFESPFPFVGGNISASIQSEGEAHLLLIDQTNNIIHGYKLISDLNTTTDSFFAVLTQSPTYKYSMIFRIEAKSSLLISSFRVKTYFQFAKMALLKLHEGENSIGVHFPDGKMTALEASVWTD